MLLTRPPLAPFPLATKQSSFDLHVLGTPPAFILSQDQTRHPIVYTAPSSQRVFLPVLVRRSRSLPRSLKRVDDSKRRSCDPGQAACYFVNTWLFADCVPAPPLVSGELKRKLTGTACLFVVCVSVYVCLCQDDRSCEDHPSSSCCLFCFPLFNCSGPTRGGSKPGGSSLTIGQSTPGGVRIPPRSTGRCVSSGSITHL